MSVERLALMPAEPQLLAQDPALTNARTEERSARSARRLATARSNPHTRSAGLLLLDEAVGAERLLDIADTFLVELDYVPRMPGHQYARYLQRRRILRHLRAEALRQADIDQNEVDLERREQQYRRGFFAVNVTWNPSYSNAVRIIS
jgi:hypothetical protein